jgi:hypothetical protein
MNDSDWIDVTHPGSSHDEQLNPVTGKMRHRARHLGVDGEWLPGPAPGTADFRAKDGEHA